MSPELVAVATFDPPDAHPRFAEWRQRNAALLDELTEDEIRIDTGRAEGGDFIRVWLTSDAADRAL